MPFPSAGWNALLPIIIMQMQKSKRQMFRETEKRLLLSIPARAHLPVQAILPKWDMRLLYLKPCILQAVCWFTEFPNSGFPRPSLPERLRGLRPPVLILKQMLWLEKAFPLMIFSMSMMLYLSAQVQVFPDLWALKAKI